LNLVISSPAAENVNLVVTDLSGKVVMKVLTQLKPGNNIRQLGVQHLAQGSYLVKVLCNTGCETATQLFIRE
jgi:hypothetical protein